MKKSALSTIEVTKIRELVKKVEIQAAVSGPKKRKMEAEPYYTR